MLMVGPNSSFGGKAIHRKPATYLGMTKLDFIVAEGLKVRQEQQEKSMHGALKAASALHAA
jgi:FMN-dependent NADH-azoreductase